MGGQFLHNTTFCVASLAKPHIGNKKVAKKMEKQRGSIGNGAIT
jgi:hypothetical protein